jgi:hypothetical protein
MRESSRARAAFTAYLALGPGRSLERLAATYQTCTKPAPPTRHLTTLKQWSAAHRWQERVMQHERELAASAAHQADEERLAELSRRRTLQKQLGIEMERHGIEAVRRHAAAGTIGVSQAVALLREGAALLYRALGEPDLTIAHNLGLDLNVDLSTLTDAELDERLHKLRLLNSPHHPGA